MKLSIKLPETYKDELLELYHTFRNDDPNTTMEDVIKFCILTTYEQQILQK